jgi:hypothetical protein
MDVFLTSLSFLTGRSVVDMSSGALFFGERVRDVVEMSVIDFLRLGKTAPRV